MKEFSKKLYKQIECMSKLYTSLREISREEEVREDRLREAMLRETLRRLDYAFEELNNLILKEGE